MEQPRYCLRAQGGWPSWCCRRPILQASFHARTLYLLTSAPLVASERKKKQQLCWTFVTAAAISPRQVAFSMMDTPVKSTPTTCSALARSKRHMGRSLPSTSPSFVRNRVATICASTMGPAVTGHNSPTCLGIVAAAAAVAARSSFPAPSARMAMPFTCCSPRTLRLLRLASRFDGHSLLHQEVLFVPRLFNGLCFSSVFVAITYRVNLCCSS